MACGGILQCSPGIGLESCRDMQSQHSLWPDDDGAGRSSGDRSVSQAACSTRDELGREAHGHGVLRGLEGDVRVDGDRILVTYYNAPDADKLREHYENLPAKLRAENIDPRVPWLYGFQIDYCFR